MPFIEAESNMLSLLNVNSRNITVLLVMEFPMIKISLTLKEICCIESIWAMIMENVLKQKNTKKRHDFLFKNINFELALFGYIFK